MHGFQYKILSEAENELHSKVLTLQQLNSKNELTVKIFEKKNNIYYQNEIGILRDLNEIDSTNKNNYFVRYINIDYNENMFKIPKEIRKESLKFLFFENLSKLSLCDYISFYKEKLKEIHAKYLCYELLCAIEKLQKINILHNKLDVTSNIMFDDDFNIKIIHFCEAQKINNNNKYKLNNDLFKLAILLIKFISGKKIKSIIYNKNDNKYEIIDNDEIFKSKRIEESQFWKRLEKENNINVSKQFSDFVLNLVKAKKEEKLVKISDLLNDEWLKEIKNDVQTHEENFKNDFKLFYETINEDKDLNNPIEADYNDMNNNGGNEAMSAININIKDGKLIPSLKREKRVLPLKSPNQNNINENNQIQTNKQIENQIPISYIQQNNINNEVSKSILRAFPKTNKNSENNEPREEKHIFRPRKDDFNYLKISIKNTENKDINQAVINFMKVFKNDIKEYYAMNDININFDDIKDLSFKICYEIPPIHFDDEDDIEFLDEDFEQKVKNSQNFEIKVELLEGEDNKNPFINTYFLVFRGISIGKEDFYDYLKILKDIAKNSLKKKD